MIRMKYIELTVRTTSEASEIVSDVLWNYTEGGVAVSDVADVIALRTGKMGVYWDYLDDDLTKRTGALVKAFLLPEAARKIPAIMEELYVCRDRAAGAIDFGTLEESTREIDGDDWIEIWKKHFHPIRLGKIVVVPAWLEYDKAAEEEVILLDSSMAFGTGEHETTAMCVELMQRFLKAGDTVLDVGCGSGILGIAAAKLGAKRCFLTDIDPIAVASSEHNARANGVEQRIEVVRSNLVDDTSMQADLILANITAEVLVLLAPAIPAHLKRGGTLILSGIIEGRTALVKEAYAAAGLSLVREEKRGEWYAFVLKEGSDGCA